MGVAPELTETVHDCLASLCLNDAQIGLVFVFHAMLWNVNTFKGDYFGF